MKFQKKVCIVIEPKMDVNKLYIVKRRVGWFVQTQRKLGRVVMSVIYIANIQTNDSYNLVSKQSQHKTRSLHVIYWLNV